MTITSGKQAPNQQMCPKSIKWMDIPTAPIVRRRRNMSCPHLQSSVVREGVVTALVRHYPGPCRHCTRDHSIKQPERSVRHLHGKVKVSSCAASEREGCGGERIGHGLHRVLLEALLGNGIQHLALEFRTDPENKNIGNWFRLRWAS